MDRKLEARKRRPFGAIAAVAIVAIVGVVALWPSRQAGAASYQVYAGERYPELEGRAVLEPARVTVVSAQSDGVVATLPVATGTAVEKGAPLATLVNPTLSAELRQAELAFRNTEAAAQIAQADLRASLLDREAEATQKNGAMQTANAELEAYQRLYERGGVSRLALEKVEAQAQQAATDFGFAKQKLAQYRATTRAHVVASRSNVEIARERFQEARQSYDALTISTPAQGVISRLDMKIGQKVSPGDAVGEIISADLVGDIGIPQDAASALEVGQQVAFRASQGTFAGTITSILPRAVDGVVHAKVALRDAPRWLRPDIVCEATVTGKRKVSGLFVRAPAGLLADSTAQVAVIDRAGNRRVATVEFGSRFGDALLVRRGADAGERIAVLDGE